MNIFALEGHKNNIDWEKSATSLDDGRVAKMVLESAQILSDALCVKGLEHPYKPYNVNGRFAQWAAHSSANFIDLVTLGCAISREYTIRYRRQHNSQLIINKCSLIFDRDKFDCHEPTDLPLTMPAKYRDPDDIVGSYQRFFASKPFIRYRPSTIPAWFLKHRGDLPWELIPEETGESVMIRGKRYVIARKERRHVVLKRI